MAKAEEQGCVGDVAGQDPGQGREHQYGASLPGQLGGCSPYMQQGGQKRGPDAQEQQERDETRLCPDIQSAVDIGSGVLQIGELEGSFSKEGIVLQGGDTEIDGFLA